MIWVIALDAPVEVGMMELRVLRVRRLFFLCELSRRFWELVAAWMVVPMHWAMPYSLSRIARMGQRALVVQEALEMR